MSSSSTVNANLRFDPGEVIRLAGPELEEAEIPADEGVQEIHLLAARGEEEVVEQHDCAHG